MSNSASKSKLIVLSAPSGTGKTTLCAYLVNTYGGRLKLSISTTTRPARGREVEGREYFFVSRAEFEKKITAGDFAEWAEVHGQLYGTSKATLEAAMSQGHHVLLDIDVQGAARLKHSFGDRCVLIFLSPPSLEELEKRLKARNTESPESIEKRLLNARAEMQRAKDFDYQLVNDRLDQAQERLRAILDREMGGD